MPEATLALWWDGRAHWRPIEPLTELRIEVIEIAEAAAEEEIFRDVTERALDPAFCLGRIRPTHLGEVAVVRAGHAVSNSPCASLSALAFSR